MPTSRVVAWALEAPTVRLVARATAEAALRGGVLQVLSPSAPPGQWPSWRAAAANLGVTAGWTVVPRPSRHPGMPPALLSEVARASLVVTDAATLRSQRGEELVRHADLYVVADAHPEGRSLLREPAVVVGVPDAPDDVHLLAVASDEADRRHRNLIIVHARPRGDAGETHQLEHRWLGLVAPVPGADGSHSPSRVVLTRRPVVAALQDHVDTEDVLVVGVHQCGDTTVGTLADSALFDEPPCDLLLTDAGHGCGPTRGAHTERDHDHLAVAPRG